MQQSSKKAVKASLHICIKISKDGREDIIFNGSVSETAIKRVLKLADYLMGMKIDPPRTERGLPSSSRKRRA